MSPVETPDTVVAVGTIARSAAATLASGLSRTLVELQDVDAARELMTRRYAGSMLIVAPRDAVGPIALAAEAAGQAVGFCTDSDEATLLVRAEALLARLLVASDATARLVYDAAEAGPPKLAMDDTGTLWLYGELEANAVATSLASDKRLLVLRSHADGFSMQLSGAVLCTALAQRTGTAKPHRPAALPCFSTGWCGRLDGSIDALALDGRLISVSTPKADILINLSCHGTLLSPSTDWHHSIGALIDYRRVGQMIACWGQTQLFDEELRHIVRAVSFGHSLGAVRQLVQHFLRRRGGPALAVLFGDPTYIAVPRDQVPALPFVATPDHEAAHEYLIPSAADDGTEFAALLHNAICSEDDSGGGLDSPRDPPSLSIDALLTLLSNRAKALGSMLMHSWLPFVVHDPAAVRTVECPNCGDWATIREWQFRDQAAPPRNLSVCIACGPVAEFTAGMPPTEARWCATTHSLSVSLPRYQVISAQAVVEFWPRVLSRSLPVSITGETVCLQTGEDAFDAVPAQRAIISVFVWTNKGLVLHRYPLQIEPRPSP